MSIWRRWEIGPQRSIRSACRGFCRLRSAGAGAGAGAGARSCLDDARRRLGLKLELLVGKNVWLGAFAVCSLAATATVLGSASARVVLRATVAKDAALAYRLELGSAATNLGHR